MMRPELHRALNHPAIPSLDKEEPMTRNTFPGIDASTSPYAALLLRLTLGVVFVAHALLKLLVLTLPGTAAFSPITGSRAGPRTSCSRRSCSVVPRSSLASPHDSPR